MLTLARVDDPRDALEATRRMDLVRYAHQVGLKHITDTMPHWLIVEELRRQGHTNPPFPRQMLGEVQGASSAEPASTRTGEVSLNDHLRAEWERSQQEQEPEPEPPPFPPEVIEEMTVKPRPGDGLRRLALLRKECKDKGIKMGRKESEKTLLQKLGRLNGQDTP